MANIYNHLSESSPFNLLLLPVISQEMSPLVASFFFFRKHSGLKIIFACRGSSFQGRLLCWVRDAGFSQFLTLPGGGLAPVGNKAQTFWFSQTAFRIVKNFLFLLSGNKLNFVKVRFSNSFWRPSSLQLSVLAAWRYLEQHLSST